MLRETNKTIKKGYFKINHYILIFSVISISKFHGAFAPRRFPSIQVYQIFRRLVLYILVKSQRCNILHSGA